jgi:DNA repair protein RadC
MRAALPTRPVPPQLEPAALPILDAEATALRPELVEGPSERDGQFLTWNEVLVMALKQIALPAPVVAKQEVIISAPALRELGGLLGDTTESISMSLVAAHSTGSGQAAVGSTAATQAIFTTAGFTLTTRLIDGQYPDVERILPKGCTTRAILDVRELNRAVKLAGLIASVSQNVVKLSVSAGEATQAGTVMLSANAAGIGTNTGSVEGQVAGEGGQIALNVKYLGEALTVIGTPQVAFEMVTAQALEPYVDLRKLRRLAAHGGNLQEALITGAVPEDVQAMITFVAELLRPVGRDQVKSPADAAAFLMARMGLLDQEELWTMLLNTKNYVIKIHRVYQGSLNSSMVRIGEVFREALKLNAAALIVAHNHPSGSVDASPEDVLVTRQIVEAGKLLDVDVLDHLILSKGKWQSLREKGLGFSNT